jgi:hypothetical protein
MIGRFPSSVQAPDTNIFMMFDDLKRYDGFDLSLIAIGAKSFSMTAQKAFDVNCGSHEHGSA